MARRKARSMQSRIMKRRENAVIFALGLGELNYLQGLKCHEKEKKTPECF